MRQCGYASHRHLAQLRSGDPLPTGFTLLETADHLYALLAESDCVAVCCQRTPETTNLIAREAFAVMKTETILVNVARGEIIDEEALATTTPTYWTLTNDLIYTRLAPGILEELKRLTPRDVRGSPKTRLFPHLTGDLRIRVGERICRL
jgi:hypothetical protein